jgi:hypothetical protein
LNGQAKAAKQAKGCLQGMRKQLPPVSIPATILKFAYNIGGT